MTPDEVRELILAFPGAEEGTSYGQPSYKVNGKFFTRLRSEDQSLVLLDVSHDEREMLMEAEPATFHITPHYGGAVSGGSGDCSTRGERERSRYCDDFEHGVSLLPK